MFDLSLTFYQVPILSLGDDVGKREIKCSAKSNLSGDYVIEDVLSNDDAVFRRLIFLNNPYLVQSEAKLIKSKNFHQIHLFYFIV